MTSKRKYTKKNNSYWSSFGKKELVASPQPVAKPEDFAPQLCGTPFYTSTAAEYARNPESTRRSSSRAPSGSISPIENSYSNLEVLSAPFDYDKDGVSDAKESIKLCQKAYYHVPIFRNTIDMLSELSNSDLVLSGGTKASRAFIKKWMDSAKIDAVKSQYFREYYRSGNVFLYRMYAKFNDDELKAMKTIYANSELIPQDSGFPKKSLPMKYVLLNPLDIVNYESIGTTTVYKKVLSKFEALRIKNPKTEEEKKILENVKRSQNVNSLDIGSNEIFMDLEATRLIFSFYKKQDYEPFSVPFGFPVLRDINWKLELKKIDQSVSRSLENIILLITMGNEPTKGGINPRNLEAMKELFGSEAVGRVLVADYTTKAQFIIPQLDNILGPQKYEIVNQDIKEGLQNIFFEEAKYSNSEIKIKLFFEKLKEGKKTFLDDFLQPEIKKVCSAMGFRDFPKARFKAATALNENEIQKAAMRLIELGIMHPKQGVDSINNSELPDSTEIGEGQVQYKKEREEGQYTPLVGGPPLYVPVTDAAQADLDLKKEAAKAPKTGAPVKVPSKQVGKPSSKSIANEELISVKSIAEIAKSASNFEKFAKNHMKKTKGLKSLSEGQASAVESLCSSIIESNEKENWEKTFMDCCSSNANIENLNIKPEILDISKEYDIPTYEGAMIYHSRKIKI